MRIGFIGAGKVAHMIARHMLTAGHQVVMSNSHGPFCATLLARPHPERLPGWTPCCARPTLVKRAAMTMNSTRHHRCSHCGPAPARPACRAWAKRPPG